MKKLHIVGIVIIALVVMAIMSTIADSTTYTDFTEAAVYPEKTFQVVGVLSEGKEIEYNPDVNANLFTFYMVDKKGKEMKVFYPGSKPQDFERSDQIVITGHMSEEGFQASKLLLKCPSKYNNGEELKSYTATAET